MAEKSKSKVLPKTISKKPLSKSNRISPMKIKKKTCPTCGGTGIEYSGVCHCGAEMDGHSIYDNHTATEMYRPCPDCLACCIKALNAWKRFASECEQRKVKVPLWASLLNEKAVQLTEEALSTFQR